MGIIRAWKCDICQKEFVENPENPISLNHGGFYFEFEMVNSFNVEVKEEFDTICLKCRGIMMDAIDNGLEQCGSEATK